ncbi:Protein T19B10.3 [Aphelenchoides avenae]|nr:Protein T19B10.3 [Aphelenchus avenae]
MHWLLVFSTTLLAYLCLSDAKRTFEIDYDNDQFLKDGKPYRYISGEIHYFRIHPSLWNDRLKRYRAAGLNAVQVYVPWNFHEPTPGMYNFANERNLTEFVLLAQKNELDVLLRIGPYICAEWENGGFPWWLNHLPQVKLRTSDNAYISAVRRYLNTLLQVIDPLTYKNGGPVIMLQIENEYGSVGICDKPYLRFLRDEVRAKLGNDTVLYTTDGIDDGMVECGSVEGVYPTIDFGTHINVTNAFAAQRKIAPKGPLVNSEFYPGWFMQWGGSVPYKSPDAMMDSIREMYAHNASFSIYMFHGGTNFGFWNGAQQWGNHGAWGGTKATMTTNYDYSAPITEAGQIREHFLEVRKFIKSIPNWVNPPLSVPKNHSSFSVTGLGTTLVGDLLEVFNGTISPYGCRSSEFPLRFEDILQAYGYAIYWTYLPSSGRNVNLSIPEIHDAAFIYVDGQYEGYLQRLFNTSLTLTNVAKGQKLSLIVENQGRVNYPIYPATKDYKGILSNVTVDGQQLTEWTQCGVNLDVFEDVVEQRLRKLSKRKKDKSTPRHDRRNSPGVWVAKFEFDAPDTFNHSFWDSTGWGKGQFILNGFNLGRYWPSRGPQATLYAPGATFQKENTAIAIELLGCERCDALNFVKEPIYL